MVGFSFKYPLKKAWFFSYSYTWYLWFYVTDSFLRNPLHINSISRKRISHSSIFLSHNDFLDLIYQIREFFLEEMHPN